MNLDQLKKNVNQRVQLRPIARRFDEDGRELEQLDDDWIMAAVTDDGVRILNPRTGHATTLGRDHVHHYTSNPDRSQTGIKHGFLTLNVQISLCGTNLTIEPNAAPGQPTGASALEALGRIEKARLMDERFERVKEDFMRRGTPKPMIDTYSDLTTQEKAELYERVVQWKHGRPSKNNPYR